MTQTQYYQQSINNRLVILMATIRYLHDKLTACTDSKEQDALMKKIDSVLDDAATLEVLNGVFNESVN